MKNNAKRGSGLPCRRNTYNSAVTGFAALLIGRFSVSPADFAGAVMRFFTGGSAETDAVIGMASPDNLSGALRGGLAVSAAPIRDFRTRRHSDTLPPPARRSVRRWRYLGGGIFPIQLSALRPEGAVVLTKPLRRQGERTSAVLPE